MKLVHSEDTWDASSSDSEVATRPKFFHFFHKREDSTLTTRTPQRCQTPQLWWSFVFGLQDPQENRKISIRSVQASLLSLISVNFEIFKLSFFKLCELWLKWVLTGTTANGVSPPLARYWASLGLDLALATSVATLCKKFRRDHKRDSRISIWCFHVNECSEAKPGFVGRPRTLSS